MTSKEIFIDKLIDENTPEENSFKYSILWSMREVTDRHSEIVKEATKGMYKLGAYEFKSMVQQQFKDQLPSLEFDVEGSFFVVHSNDSALLKEISAYLFDLLESEVLLESQAKNIDY